MASTSREISASTHDVFAVLADPSTYPEWLAGAADVRDIDDDWPQPGAKFYHRVGIGPFTIPDSTKVLDIEPLPRVNLENMQKAARGEVTERLPGVRRVQEALNERYELDIKVDGTWDAETTEGYKHHQKKIGNDPEFVDGIPGPLDLGDLGGGRFRVVD